GIETVMGLGGIHACCNPGVYKNNKNLIIHDVDVNLWRLNPINCWNSNRKDVDNQQPAKRKVQRLSKTQQPSWK
ncbi:MAG TPA: hypothetical protein PLH46_04730, partial [Caldisericia bacterium]|nr:hypothetical protein [Caldisericia bacterium]